MEAPSLDIDVQGAPHQPCPFHPIPPWIDGHAPVGMRGGDRKAAEINVPAHSPQSGPVVLNAIRCYLRPKTNVVDLDLDSGIRRGFDSRILSEHDRLRKNEK